MDAKERGCLAVQGSFQGLCSTNSSVQDRNRVSKNSQRSEFGQSSGSAAHFAIIIRYGKIGHHFSPKDSTIAPLVVVAGRQTFPTNNDIRYETAFSIDIRPVPSRNNGLPRPLRR